MYFVFVYLIVSFFVIMFNFDNLLNTVLESILNNDIPYITRIESLAFYIGINSLIYFAFVMLVHKLDISKMGKIILILQLFIINWMHVISLLYKFRVWDTYSEVIEKKTK